MAHVAERDTKQRLRENVMSIDDGRCGRPRCTFVHPSRRRCWNTAVFGATCWTHTPSAPGCLSCLGRDTDPHHDCAHTPKETA